MLNLLKAPDEIITEIITQSFDMAINSLSAEDAEEWFECSYPNVAEVFLIETAIKTLERLSFCHQSPGVYGFNDFHLVIIYDALHLYCEHNNAMAGEEAPIIKGTKIVELNFEELLKQYFPNTDFCPSCLVKREGKPLSRELECRLLRENHISFSSDKDVVPLFTLTSTVYPDLQCSENRRNDHD